MIANTRLKVANAVLEDHIDGGGGVAVDVDEIEGGIKEFFSGVGAAGGMGGFWVYGSILATKHTILILTD